jgi:hypothetical protein
VEGERSARLHQCCARGRIPNGTSTGSRGFEAGAPATTDVDAWVGVEQLGRYEIGQLSEKGIVARVKPLRPLGSRTRSDGKGVLGSISATTTGASCGLCWSISELALYPVFRTTLPGLVAVTEWPGCGTNCWGAARRASGLGAFRHLEWMRCVSIATGAPKHEGGESTNMTCERQLASFEQRQTPDREDGPSAEHICYQLPLLLPHLGSSSCNALAVLSCSTSPVVF